MMVRRSRRDRRLDWIPRIFKHGETGIIAGAKIIFCSARRVSRPGSTSRTVRRAPQRRKSWGSHGDQNGVTVAKRSSSRDGIAAGARVGSAQTSDIMSGDHRGDSFAQVIYAEGSSWCNLWASTRHRRRRKIVERLRPNIEGRSAGPGRRQRRDPSSATSANVEKVGRKRSSPSETGTTLEVVEGMRLRPPGYRRPARDRHERAVISSARKELSASARAWQAPWSSSPRTRSTEAVPVVFTSCAAPSGLCAVKAPGWRSPQVKDILMLTSGSTGTSGSNSGQLKRSRPRQARSPSTGTTPPSSKAARGEPRAHQAWVPDRGDDLRTTTVAKR